MKIPPRPEYGVRRSRKCREIVSRLQTLNDEELRFLVGADNREQGYMLWIAACRRYTFIGEFAVEVLRSAISPRKWM